MAALLGRWLREVCELDREIESLDHELSCGGLVANVLLKKGVVKSSEVSSVSFSEDPEQRAANWFTLDALLQKKLGLNLDPKIISGVILEHAGAAAKLALVLKCKLEPETVPFKKKLEARKQRDELFVAKKSVVAKPVPAKAIEDLVRGRLGQKEGEMALHMARFENVRIKREEALIEQGTLEAVQVAMAMDDVRERAIQKLRENRAFLNDWTEKQAKSWRKNQRVKRDRIRTQLSFELTCRARKQAKENKERIDHASQVHWSTTAFEKNLKRLGLEGTEERGEKFEQMAEGFQERHLQDLEKAFAAMSTESAQLMARLHRQEVEGVDARRQREQRRRKLNCDNVKVQKQVEAARDKGAQIARMLGQAHIERESAATARRKRQQIALRAEAGRRFADLMTIERDAAFRRAMLKDREFLKQSQLDMIKAAKAPVVVPHKLDGRKSRNNVASASCSSTQNTKKVKHYNTAQDTVDLVVGLALEVCDLRAENHRAKLKTNVWLNMKRAFINGSDKLRNPTKRLFEQLVSPTKESHDCSLEEEARNFCEGLANLSPDPVRLSQATLDDLCKEQDQVKLGRPCLTKGALVIIGMSPLCDSICTRLSFGLSLEVLSVQQYLDEVEAHLQSLQEDTSSDPESQATKEVKGNKGQQGGKRSNKGAKLDLTTILSREELLSMLAEVPEENRREASELARLVAIDLAEKFEGKAVVLNQIIATKEQAQIIEYLQLDLEERASLSFDAFVKLENSGDEPCRTTSLLAGILVGGLETVNNESLTALAEWLTSHTAVLPVDHVDAEESKAIADAIELIVPFVLENVALCESPEDLPFGLSLVRAQQEGLALPEGVQPLLNLAELHNVQASLFSVQELFQRRCTSAALKLAQLRRQIYDIAKGMYQDGIHLLRGGSVTPDIQQLGEWFRQAKEQVKDVFAMDDLVTGLGQHLWTEALEKSLAATEEFSKWKAKDWVSSLSDCVSAVFIELVDAELLYYTEARSCLKEYHAAVEPLARVVHSRKALVKQALQNRVKVSELGNEHNQMTDLESATEDPGLAHNSSPDKGDFSAIDSHLNSFRNETQKEPSTAKSSNSEDENQCIRNNSSLEGLGLKKEAKDLEEARSHDLISFEELVSPDVGEPLLRKAKQALRSISLRESRGECEAVGTSSMAELNVHFRARVRGELEEASRMFEACQFAFDTLFVELEKAMRARIIVEDASIRTFTDALTCAIRSLEQPSDWLQSTIAHLDAPDGLPETLLLPNSSSSRDI